MGQIIEIDILITYPTWPRAWPVGTDWLPFANREHLHLKYFHHFLFFSDRILGPLSLDCAMPSFPGDPSLCETALSAQLCSLQGRLVNILARVGGAQPERQELTIKGSIKSRPVSDFNLDSISDGKPFS